VVTKTSANQRQRERQTHEQHSKGRYDSLTARDVNNCQYQPRKRIDQRSPRGALLAEAAKGW